MDLKEEMIFSEIVYFEHSSVCYLNVLPMFFSLQKLCTGSLKT